MSRKTVEIPPGWKPPPAEKPKGLPRLWVFVSGLFGPEDPVDELQEQGWRYVGRDENGQKLYAPPARYSIWSRWP